MTRSRFNAPRITGAMVMKEYFHIRLRHQGQYDSNTNPEDNLKNLLQSNAPEDGSQKNLLDNKEEWSSFVKDQAKKTKQFVYLFIYQAKLYAKNPYIDLPKKEKPKGVSDYVYPIPVECFDQLVSEGKITVETDWQETAAAIGLGDGIGEFVNVMRHDVFTKTAFSLPVAGIVAFGNFYLQWREYKKKFDKYPPAKQVREIVKESVAHSFKVVLTILSWKATLDIGKKISQAFLTLLHITPHSLLGMVTFHLTMGLIIGVTRGIMLAAKDAANDLAREGTCSQGKNENLHVNNAKGRAKLFMVGFLDGITWYAISFIPFAKTILGLKGVAADVVNGVARGVTTGFAIFLAFALYKPKETAASCVTGGKRAMQIIKKPFQFFKKTPPQQQPAEQPNSAVIDDAQVPAPTGQ